MLLIQEIYYTLASENDKNVFEATLKVLEDYFVPTFLSSDICFNKLCRQVVKLRTNLSVDCICTRTVACKFGTNEDDQICDQFTDKCFSSRLHQEFLQKQGIVS